MTEAEHQRLTDIEDLVRRAQMSARLAVALLPPERAVSGKNLADVREELAAGVQALRDALAGLETLRLETLREKAGRVPGRVPGVDGIVGVRQE